jgi:hypothetical protein
MGQEGYLTDWLPQLEYRIDSDQCGAAYGNAGRNSLRDNGFYQMNAGLHKVFPLWSEASNLDFRCEGFNALNAVNYQNPDSNRSDGGYGAITSYFPPRQIQLALRLTF